MIQLEQTIISNARRHLSLVLAYYQRQKSIQTEEERDQAWTYYLCDDAALKALLALIHQPDAGLSDEATHALRAIEYECASAHRVATYRHEPVDTNRVANQRSTDV